MSSACTSRQRPSDRRARPRRPAARFPGSAPLPPRVLTVVLPLVAAATIGCVQRRMTIRSDPPGALVYVDDYQIGTTPVSHDFVYYGTRKIRLVKDGFETLTVRQPFPVPWYQVFPLDFVTENLWPGEIRDERVVSLSMQPAGIASPEALVTRAEQVRLAAGSLPPAAPAVVAPPPPPPPQPIPAPQPAVPPFQQYPQAGPPVPAFPGLQPPVQNAPRQGVP